MPRNLQHISKHELNMTQNFALESDSMQEKKIFAKILDFLWTCALVKISHARKGLRVYQWQLEKKWNVG